MKLTKEEFDIQKNLNIPLFISLLVVFVVIAFSIIWFQSDIPLTMRIIMSVFSLAIIIFLSIYIPHYYKNLNISDIYIAEDVFIHVHTKKIWTPAKYNQFREVTNFHTVKFSKNGEFNIQTYSKLFEKSTLEAEQDPDYITVTLSKPGDKFYLTVSELNGKKTIHKAFNAKYFKIDTDDFELINGKYVLKKSNSDIQGENNGK